MPARVIPHRLPSCPGRDSRFTIRHHSGRPGQPWWVFYEPEAGDRIPADDSHEELINLVNYLKQQEGQSGGGAFSINEHGQVIARTSASTAAGGQAMHVVGLREDEVIRYRETITFSAGTLDPRATPGEGETWPGPRCGMTYKFVAPRNPKPPSRNFDEVFVEIEGKVIQLSTDAQIRPYPPQTGPVADFLAALRRQLPNGGRFRVNEHGRAFTADRSIFIGRIPDRQWFKPLRLRENC
jgi:hypothetical protein